MRNRGTLIVDQHAHAAEIAKLHSQFVCGPTVSDYSIWTGAVGADTYGRIHLS